MMDAESKTQTTPSPKSRWRRWLKLVLSVVLIMAMGLLLLIYWLLYSDSGSRWLIQQAGEFVPLEINQTAGSIATELTAVDIVYQQDGTEIKVNRMTYRIKAIDWWQRQLVFDYIRIGDISLSIASNEEPTTEKSLPVKTPIKLPLSVAVNQLFIQQIDVNDGSFRKGPLWVKAAVDTDGIDIETLQLLDKDIELKVSGQVDLNSHWPFELDTRWAYHPENISGQGLLTGDISALNFTQSIHSENNYAQGNSQLKGQLGLFPALSVDAELKAHRLALPVTHKNGFKTALEAINLAVKGDLDDYQISFSGVAEQQIQALTASSKSDTNPPKTSTYRNIIKLVADGNGQQLEINRLEVTGDFGQLTAPTVVTFSPQLTVKTQLNTDAFNPQWLVPDWPGDISGSGGINISRTAQQDWQLAVTDLNLQGQLKNKTLNLLANAGWQQKHINLHPFELTWGDNQVEVNGQLSTGAQASAKALNFNFDLPEPQLMLPQLSGDLKGSGQISGSLKAFEYDLTLQADGLAYEEQKLNSLSLTGQGQWPDNLAAKLTASDIFIADQALNKVQLKVNGNLQKHQIESDIDHQNLTTHIALAGGWQSKQHQWSGQINDHKIQLKDSDMQWRLKAPADLLLGADLQLSASCWQSVNGDGQACAELNMQTKPDLSVNAELQLKNLQAALLQNLLPKELTLDGMIQGDVDVSYKQNKLAMTADLRTEEAAVNYLEGQKGSYQVILEKAELTASQESGQTQIHTDLGFADGSFLKASAKLKNQADSAWPIINAELDGHMKNSRFLVALSPELEQLEGEFSLNGDIEGALNQPRINLEFQQQSGFLVLRQTGSRLSHIKLNVESSAPGTMTLNATADSDKGVLKSTGELQLTESNDWTYQGDIKGSDFRLLTLPEIKININPDIKIEASAQAIDVSGRLQIPMAQVNIKNLPPSATTTSADINIHRPSDETSETAPSIPVHYDITTEIKEPIDIQLMGLQAKVAGQLRVFDFQQQTFAEGRLNLTEGFYKIYGRQLDIKHGELIFNGPIENPAIDVKATRESDDKSVIAGILITGTVNQLQTTLYSEPALSQLQVLSYLVTGRGLNEGGNTDGNQLAQAAILLGLKKGDSVFTQLQNAFGIDVLTIKQGVNNEDSYIEAGQNISEDLYVGYSQGLFNRLGFWILRYKINDALRLETTQGENQTVDLIYIRRKK